MRAIALSTLGYRWSEAVQTFWGTVLAVEGGRVAIGSLRAVGALGVVCQIGVKHQVLVQLLADAHLFLHGLQLKLGSETL